MTGIEKFITGDGCEIAYRFDGANDLPVLILSNSIATTHRMWDDQIAELSKSFRVLRYDTRGHGASDAPTGPYSLDRLGRDVIELVDALAIKRAHFCGLSLGGFIGQWLGVREPNRIDRLVLSNTSPYLAPPSQWDELIRALLDKRDMSAMADMFIQSWFPKSMWEQHPDVIDRFRSMIIGTSPDGLAGCFAVVRDSDLRRTNTLIDRPTMVIGGRDDTVTLASHSEQIALAIPGAQLVIMPGVHMLNVEVPSEFVHVLRSFLMAAD